MVGIDVNYGDLDVDLERADDRVFGETGNTYDQGDTAGDTQSDLLLTFQRDLEIIAIAVRFRLVEQSTFDPGGSGPPNFTSFHSIRWELATQSQYVRPDNPGIYYHSYGVVRPAVAFNDTTNGPGGIGSGDTVHLEDVVIDPRDDSVDVDTNPDAGQEIFLNSELESIPDANAGYRAEAQVYVVER